MPPHTAVILLYIVLDFFFNIACVFLQIGCEPLLKLFFSVDDQIKEDEQKTSLSIGKKGLIDLWLLKPDHKDG